jgi:hypothetical protein
MWLSPNSMQEWVRFIFPSKSVTFIFILLKRHNYINNLEPERKPVFGRKVAQMQGAEKFATGAY